MENDFEDQWDLNARLPQDWRKHGGTSKIWHASGPRGKKQRLHWRLNQIYLLVLEHLLWRNGFSGQEVPFCYTLLWQRFKMTFTSTSADASWTESKSNFGDVRLWYTHTHICYREFFFCLLLINWHFIKPRTVSKNRKFQLKQIKNIRSTQTTGTALGHVFSTPILVTVFTSLESCLLLFKMLLLIGHPYLNHFSPLSKTISPSFKPEHVTSQQNLPPSQLLV